MMYHFQSADDSIAKKIPIVKFVFLNEVVDRIAQVFIGQQLAGEKVGAREACIAAGGACRATAVDSAGA